MENQPLSKGVNEKCLECDVCKAQNIQSDAVSYCMVCTEVLCMTCDKVHRNSKLTRKHPFLTGDQLSSVSGNRMAKHPVMMCDKHQLLIKYFCKEDDAVLCETCKMASHTESDVMEICDYVAEVDPTKGVSVLHDRLTNLEQSYKQLHAKRTEDKSVFKVKIQKCLDDVQNVRKDVDTILDDLELKMVSKIKDIEDQTNKEIEDGLTVANDTIYRIRDKVTAINECREMKQMEAMFVEMKNTERKLTEYEKLKKELETKLRDVDIQFKPDDILTTLVTKLDSFGRLDGSTASKPLLDMVPTEIGRYDLGCTTVFSVIFLRDGHVVLACGKQGVKLLDKDFKQISERSLKADSACKTSDTEILIADEGDLTFIEALPYMEKSGFLEIGRRCSNVAYHNGQIYAIIYHTRRNGEIGIFDRTGELKRLLGKADGHYLFNIIWDIRLNSTGDKIFVADTDNNSVTCLDQYGHVIYEYKDDEDLDSPGAIYVDGHNNAFVCGCKSNNIKVITAAGTHHKDLLMATETDGLEEPVSIAYRPSDGCLAVGLNSDDNPSLVIYKANI